MKTREEIIHSMCLTYRHDYGLRKEPGDPPWTAGMTVDDAKMLYKTMEQIYTNDIEPIVKDLEAIHHGDSVQLPRTKEQAALMMRLAQMYFEGSK